MAGQDGGAWRFFEQGLFLWAMWRLFSFHLSPPLCLILPLTPSFFFPLLPSLSIPFEEKYLFFYPWTFFDSSERVPFTSVMGGKLLTYFLCVLLSTLFFFTLSPHQTYLHWWHRSSSHRGVSLFLQCPWRSSKHLLWPCLHCFCCPPLYLWGDGGYTGSISLSLGQGGCK